MMKHCLLALVMVSVTFWMGCARGAQGIATVTVTGDKTVVAVSLSANFSAKINGQPSNAVNWTLSSNACSGSACGSVSSSGVYTAPTTLPTGKKSMAVTVIATSQADAAATGQAAITVLPITVSVAPTPVNAGEGTALIPVIQQFTAVTIPDNAPQTFTWSVSCGGGSCGTVAQDPNNSGLAVYTAPAAPPTGCTNSNNCVTVTATSTLNPSSPSSGAAKVMVVSSRVLGAYGFRFAGFDNSQNRLALVGTVTFSSGGSVVGGVVDQVIATGGSAGHHQYAITSGLYQPSTLNDNNTNEAGTLTLGFSNGTAIQFQIVLNAAGEIRMVESDGKGTGSGVMQATTTPSQIKAASQTFAFLLTGVDPIGKRTSFAGLVTLDGTASATTQGNVSGMMDINDGGTTGAFSTMTGHYGPIPVDGLWPLTISAGGNTWAFDFYVGSGQTQNGKDPLRLFAISTDPPSVHPLLSGTLEFQDPSVTYDKTALNSTAISHLDGLSSAGSNTNVALVVASGDSNGNIAGSFDANNAGTLVSAQSFTCTYVPQPGGTCTNAQQFCGRYTMTMLGNSTTCGGTPLSFVLYATGANRGFLLDQSTAVMVGAMDPQASTNNANGTFADSALPGPFVAATVSNGTSGVGPLASNLLLSFQGLDNSGTPIATAAGTVYSPAATSVTGTYDIQFTGTGTITLTPSGAANADKFVFYAIDTSRFWMIQTQDTTGSAPANPAVIFMQQ